MSTSPVDLVAGTGDFIRVSTAKDRYLGGTMSLRWWYRQIEGGNLPHFRVGGSVLLRPTDVEAFVAKMFRDTRTSKPESVPPTEEAPPAPTQPRRSTRGGLRFFTD